MSTAPAAIELFWIPLGAGGHSVRFNGKVYEALVAAHGHRPRYELYHAALVVDVDRERYTIEVAPSPDPDEASRGVVATGPVGSGLLGWWRLFRYEVRCWRDGSIPDLAYAVGVPQRVSSSPAVARRLLAAAHRVPTPVWGRDELRAGDMWNSNSVAAWLIATAGVPAASVHLPAGGRAPGWDAGIEVARRQHSSTGDGCGVSIPDPRLPTHAADNDIADWSESSRMETGGLRGREPDWQ
jgi:hypothetical protein